MRNRFLRHWYLIFAPVTFVLGSVEPLSRDWRPWLLLAVMGVIAIGVDAVALRIGRGSLSRAAYAAAFISLVWGAQFAIVLRMNGRYRTAALMPSPLDAVYCLAAVFLFGWLASAARAEAR